MSLFGAKNPPKACPKCGEAGGWNVRPFDSYLREADDVTEIIDYPNQPNSVFLTLSCVEKSRNSRGPLGLSVMKQDKKIKMLLYHCDKCGFEKAY